MRERERERERGEREREGERERGREGGREGEREREREGCVGWGWGQYAIFVVFNVIFDIMLQGYDVYLH